MRKFPKIGTRVKYKGGLLIPPLVGTVTEHYPGDGEMPDSVAIKPDVLPENWPYPGYDCFAPDLSEIEPVTI